MSHFEACKAMSNNCKKMGALLIGITWGFLLGNVMPGQEPGFPESSIPPAVSRQVQRDLLEAQIAVLQATLEKDRIEGQRKKAQYDQYVQRIEQGSPMDPIPSRMIDKIAAEAQQAMGRVEMADRIVADLKRRLNALGPGADRRAEASGKTLLEIERALLIAEQSAWQPVREREFEIQVKKQKEYERYALQHPDHPVDLSGSEANYAIGRVEILDRILDGHSRRLNAIKSEIAAAGTPKAGAWVQAPKSAPPVVQEGPNAGDRVGAQRDGLQGWHLEGAAAVEKAPFKPDACYPSATLNISDGAATGTRAWTDCSNATKCSGTYVGKVTWTPPPAYMKPGEEVAFTATAGTTASNTCGYKNFSSSMAIKLNGATFVAAGESQYSGPPKATGKFTAPSGQPGAKLTIGVHLQAASVNGKVIYSYIYR